MVKKIFITLLMVITTIALTGCQEDPEEITLGLVMESDSFTLIEGASINLIYTTNDTEGVEFTVDQEGIVEITGNGSIEALQEGTVVISIVSKSDTTKKVDVTIEVRKMISLTTEHTQIDLQNTQTFQLLVDSNDGLEYESGNPDIVVVDDSGLITAKNEGTTTITVSSTYDASKSVEITVVVTKLITLSVPTTEYIMVVDDAETISYTANDTVTITSYNPDVVSVDGDTMTALKFGVATIQIKSDVDETVIEEITVTVFKKTEGLLIEGVDVMLKGFSEQFTVTGTPVGAYEDVTWSSTDEAILTVSEDGIVTAEGVGTATITAISNYDNTVAAVFDVDVLNIMVVDATKQAGDTYMLEGIELQHGANLFTTIQDALAVLEEETVVYVDGGTYTESFTINVSNVSFVGLNLPVLNGAITIDGNNVTMAGFVFEQDASITNTNVIENFVFEFNTVQNVNNSFLQLQSINGVRVENNYFNQITGTAIGINDIQNGEIIIKHNTITSATEAIVLNSNGYNIVTSINVFWNDISTVTNGINVDLSNNGNPLQIESVFRFNKITSYTKAIIANVDNQSDFTFNHFGVSELDLNDFENITEYDLDAFYVNAEDVLTEDEYDPTLPIIIRITNPIGEIMIGETHSFTYEILPRELSGAGIRYITVNPDILAINQDGVITPQTSGLAKIQIRSRQLSTIRSEYTINVITTPGIELTPSTIMNNLLVGDPISFDYVVFPYTHVNEAVTFSSSDESIATIDQSGVVTTLQSGDVTITASLVSDPSVSVDYTIQIHDSLDLTNLLDYLTSIQVQYTNDHSWIAQGFQYNYNDRRYESVSRYYFDNVVINDSKMVPVSYGIRPGELMDPLSSEIRFNEDNIHWVVIHDTASAATGSGALAHANYLYDNAVNENPLWVSWHYTIDDTYTYQHLPEVERGYHAGDGSTNPGEGSYLGGGNRNGVGIEMAINDDGDMMRTWQRTAKLAVDIAVRHDLPLSQIRYHQDFSGKICPNTLITAGLIPLFEEFKQAEYHVATEHSDAIIVFTSNNPEYLDNHGRVHTMPEQATTVSYTITVTENGVTESRTFYTYLPGTVR